MTPWSFENPEYLWLLVIPALLVLHRLWMELRDRTPHLRVSTVVPWKAGGRSVLAFLRFVPDALRIAALVLLVFALARPRTTDTISSSDAQGIDIVIAMDASTSMLARDFQPDRITEAELTAIDFIKQRTCDRMGIVVFAGESFTQCPLTTDHQTLVNMMLEVSSEFVSSGIIEDGTAIGNGLALSVARLKESDAKSKVVILLTDGMNNRGDITPEMAADIALEEGVKVYTIGIGKEGNAPYPVQTPWGVQLQNIPVEIDEALLQEIADKTGGRYFRATDNTKLAEIYGEINDMEKTSMTVESYEVHDELFGWFAIMALVCLLAEAATRMLIRRMP